MKMQKDYERLRKIFEDCFLTGYWYGHQGAGDTCARQQMDLTIPMKLHELCKFLSIEFEDGEIVSITGKEVA